MKETEILGRNIKRFRQFKGLTQGDLAKKIGLTKDTICKIELGEQKNPGLKYLIAIHKELGVSMEELFMEDPGEKVIKLLISDENVRSLKPLLAELIRILAKKED